MSREKIEAKLLAAVRRGQNAQNDEWSYTREIDWHDSEASRIRKLRQKARNRKDRAEATVKRLAQQLHEQDEL